VSELTAQVGALRSHNLTVSSREAEMKVSSMGDMEREVTLRRNEAKTKQDGKRREVVSSSWIEPEKRRCMKTNSSV